MRILWNLLQEFVTLVFVVHAAAVVLQAVADHQIVNVEQEVID